MLISSFAFAKGSSHSDTPDVTPTLIKYQKYPRVMTFRDSYNATTPQGLIVVCRPPNEATWGECKSPAKQNAWESVETIVIPGYTLDAYDFRFVGSSGYRVLNLYFRKND